MTTPDKPGELREWEPQPGQCLLCGGRGGWWSSEHRETCTRCDGTGWDPSRSEPWFQQLITPIQGGAS